MWIHKTPLLTVPGPKTVCSRGISGDKSWALAGTETCDAVTHHSQVLCSPSSLGERNGGAHTGFKTKNEMQVRLKDINAFIFKERCVRFWLLNRVYFIVFIFPNVENVTVWSYVSLNLSSAWHQFKGSFPPRSQRGCSGRVSVLAVCRRSRLSPPGRVCARCGEDQLSVGMVTKWLFICAVLLVHTFGWISVEPEGWESHAYC